MSNIKYYLLFSLPFLVFIFIFNFPAPPWPDGIVYDVVARDLLNNGVFRYLIWGDFDPSYLHANFNNCIFYPLVHLASLEILHTTDSRVLILINYILAFLTIINIKTIFKLKRSHLWLLVIFAFNPLIYQYTNFQRPEWFNIFFFTCMWICLEKRAYFLTGFLLALTAYNHQFSLFFVPCVAYGVWVREKGFSEKARSYLKVFLTTFICFLPYIYYALSNFAVFKYQLFGNQVGHSSAHGLLKFLKSIVVPLFVPSMSFYTFTGIIPRWFADLLNIGVIFALIGLVLVLKNRVKLSKITKEAGFFWLFITLGCAFHTFNPYVAVFFTIFVIGVFKDLYSEVPAWLKGVLVGVVVVSLAYQIVFMSWVKKDLFKWSDMNSATNCIAEKLPIDSKVYVLAYPDPSIQLLNMRPDLDIRRFIDFSKFSPQWIKVVQDNSYFITSGDNNLFIKYDYNSALRNKIKEGLFTGSECKYGNINLMLWRRKQ